MTIKGILFDLYGTLIDIETDESKDEIYRTIAHYLTYHGMYLHRGSSRALLPDHGLQKRRAARNIPKSTWKRSGTSFSYRKGSGSSHPRAIGKSPGAVYRAVSRNRLQLYPGVKEVLNTLRPATTRVGNRRPILLRHPRNPRRGLDGYFEPVIISSHYGYRKPDSRLFTKALDKMGLNAQRKWFVSATICSVTFTAQPCSESKPFLSTPTKARNLLRTWRRIIASASSTISSR